MRYRNGWIESVISHIEYNNRFIVSFGKFFAEVYFFAQVVDCLNDWTYNKFMQCIKGCTYGSKRRIEKLKMMYRYE